jgi:hypothetical protein
MNEHEIRASIAENMERGVIKEVAPGRYSVTELGELVVEGMMVRHKCPKLFALLTAIAVAEPAGEGLQAMLQQLRRVMSQLLDTKS